MDKYMTWGDLKKILDEMSPEQLENTVTICDTDIIEFFPVLAEAATADEDDADISGGVLAEGHLYISF